MPNSKAMTSVCPLHGKPSKRDTCTTCNAAYMKDYMRRRRIEAPAIPLWERARRRALRGGIAFSITRAAVVVPPICPILGIPLVIGGRRSANSPSLDRIIPSRGYVPGNVRVVSDRANRIKGDRNLSQLRDRAVHGPAGFRQDYEKVAAYVDREALLVEVRAKAAEGGRCGEEWSKVAAFLKRAFAMGVT